ncbi:aluminum-activated malate transporter 8-like [Juglans microcarpa x Juglans regia]|uniref:aluminum-activated malate transporter 8-like n=1 Tax=Juglans microcarpa x Juglans regia TaxID=2249226 RepID=UPI001B7E67A3|nr:aluminum-activated malate transporter 8-like [Juglans microcarpa x Juglans regia]
MDIASTNFENVGPFTRVWEWLKALPVNLWAVAVEFANKMKKLGQDDPRRIVHSLKVGVAITLVSLFYYVRPLFDRFGENGIWAVLTVVLVFEFSVGATLGKGLNRMLATLSGGALAVGVDQVATLFDGTGQPIVLGILVFIIAATVTFMRFFPELKARYDYGLMIFILTFCLVSVSSYQDDEVLDMACQRLYTIIIGCFIAIIVCICVCPVWIGENLQNQIANNLEKLGNFLEGFGREYFRLSEEGHSTDDDKSFLHGYKSVLTSKDKEETMANLARWEFWHYRFGFRHPWNRYLKVGTLTRQCAYKIEDLNSYIKYFEIQATPTEFRREIQEQCIKICSESGKALKELASAIKKLRRSTSVINFHIENSKIAAEKLKSMLNMTSLWENANLREIIPTAAVGLILIDIVPCTEKIVETFQELASCARFERMDDRVSPSNDV